MIKARANAAVLGAKAGEIVLVDPREHAALIDKGLVSLLVEGGDYVEVVDGELDGDVPGDDE